MRVALMFLIMPVIGCSAPTTSIDGLAGGALTSGVDAPAFTSETVSAELISAKTIQAEGVVSSTIEATESIVSDSIESSTVTTDSLIIRGQAAYGAPLGSVELPRIEDGRPGYRAADRQCRDAFGDSAHVCEASEVMAAYKSGIDLPISMHQAAVNTFASYTTVRVFSGDEAQDHFVNVNDCSGWVSTVAFGAAFSQSAGALVNSYPIVDTYMALHYDEVHDAWSLRPPFLQANCDEVRLACCG